MPDNTQPSPTNISQELPAERRPKTKILVDGGDPEETIRIKKLLGFVDGQTTNPSLIAKSPEIRSRIASGHKLTQREELEEYKSIVQRIAPLVGDAGVSIEVFADLNTSAGEMLAQGKEMFRWAPNAHIKYPCTHEGMRAAELSVQEGIRVNMTLCFSQQQAAAVYAATTGTRSPAYVSPFIGRLNDIGKNGLDLIANIRRMYATGDGHVLTLAASIRSVEQLLYCFSAGAELATVPEKVLQQWAAQGFPLGGDPQRFAGEGEPIAYQQLDLNQPWQNFSIDHELTSKGIRKFVEDYRATLAA